MPSEDYDLSVCVCVCVCVCVGKGGALLSFNVSPLPLSFPQDEMSW